MTVWRAGAYPGSVPHTANYHRLHMLWQYRTPHSSIRYGSRERVPGKGESGTLARSDIPALVAPCPSSVPHTPLHHSLAQYRTTHSTIA
eukprot:2697368-Rhodomonas_salina.1